jgi:hypothetical protein
VTEGLALGLGWLMLAGLVVALLWCVLRSSR